MKKILAMLFVTTMFIQCDEADDSTHPQTCGTSATVRDLTGLDGCGYVFELEDGTKLNPALELIFLGPNHPLVNFKFVDGKKVTIDYTVAERSSACMTGTVVDITCITEVAPKPCGTSATVKDLRNLDGCGFVFELEDGTRLEPDMRILFCGTPPLPKEVVEDPLYGFVFEDGKKVTIDYKVIEGASVCMAGTSVKITCLTEVTTQAGR